MNQYILKKLKSGGFFVAFGVMASFSLSGLSVHVGTGDLCVIDARILFQICLPVTQNPSPFRLN